MTEPVRGGYRPPARPAPASGPGRLSQRTDGQPLVQLPDAAYGEQMTYQAAQKAGPRAATPGAEGQPGQGAGLVPLDMSRVTPLNAPSEYPGEPVTAGADAGLGPGSEVITRGGRDPSFQNLVGMLPALEIVADSPNASRAFRSFYRMVRGNS